MPACSKPGAPLVAKADSISAAQVDAARIAHAVAPRVVKGKVIIGNGGAEFGVRGYITAYDPRDGKLLWSAPAHTGIVTDGALAAKGFRIFTTTALAATAPLRWAAALSLIFAGLR